MICEKCGKEHDGEYGSGRFCSAKCARGFSSKHVTEAGREKQKQVLRKQDTKDKSYEARMEKSENYEKDSEGRWNKISKNKQIKSNKQKNRHSVTLGRIGELTTAKKFLNHGYEVFVPLVDVSGTDMMVAKNNGTPKRVQVKSSTRTIDDNCTLFSLRSSEFSMKDGAVTSYNKTYSKDNVDYFALYSEKDDDVYLIENDESRKSIVIRNKLDPDNLTTKGKNLEKLHMAEDYQIDKVLDDIDNGIDKSKIIDINDFIDKSDE